jgi:hypothetical protein
LPGIRGRMAKLGLAVCGSDLYLERLSSSAEGRAMAPGDCDPGQRFLFIDEHGQAGPCSFAMPAYSLPLSQVSSLGDVRQLPARLAERKNAQPLRVCSDCPSTQVFGKFWRPS